MKFVLKHFIYDPKVSKWVKYLFSICFGLIGFLSYALSAFTSADAVFNIVTRIVYLLVSALLFVAGVCLCFDTYKSCNYDIVRLSDMPELKNQAAQWFHEKWNIPLSAYVESMDECLKNNSAVPQWYVAMEKNGRIIGGIGVIENDFHDRKDLTPNVCAVYVEEDRRNKFVAGYMLKFVCMDMKQKGIDTLYLVTDHTSFYERYGWKFLCMVQGDGEDHKTRMYVHKC